MATCAVTKPSGLPAQLEIALASVVKARSERSLTRVQKVGSDMGKKRPRKRAVPETIPTLGQAGEALGDQRVKRISITVPQEVHVLRALRDLPPIGDGHAQRQRACRLNTDVDRAAGKNLRL